MKYVKTFEIFGFGKKESPPKDWKDLLIMVRKNFDNIKKTKRERSISADVMLGGRFRIWCYYNKTSISLVFNNEELLNNSSGKNFDFNFQKVEISNEEYMELKSLYDEIDEWLDKESDANFGNSKTIVSKDGDIELGFDEYDIHLDELNYALNKSVFSKYTGKKFEFEISYNILGEGRRFVQERAELEIYDIKLEIAQQGGCFIDIKTKFEDRNCNIYFPSTKNPTKYTELAPNSTNKDGALTMDPIPDEVTRKEKKNQTLPNVIFYNIVPSKYNTIEFLKDLKEVMSQIDDQLRSSGKYKF
jgi:hypothetical protein